MIPRGIFPMNTMNDRIDWMKLAPRDRDALVATKVLGWVRQAPNVWKMPDGAVTSLPSFSQHWACAVMLAKMIADKGEWEVQIAMSTAPCVVEMHRLGSTGKRANACYVVGIGITGGFPEAMCQAAVQSVGQELNVEKPEPVAGFVDQGEAGPGA